MRKLTALCVVMGLTLGLSAKSWANYVIDADLSDWDVTPFVDWVPAGTADYTVTDNINLYNAFFYGEDYDFEALYFDDDAQNFFFAIVTSYPLGPASSDGGDLGIDLNGDATISPHGIVTGLEYAIRLSSGTLGDVLANPGWLDTTVFEWPDGWQGSPYRAIDGTVLGSATVAIEYYDLLESGTYIAEVAVSRDLFPAVVPGDTVTLHITQWCGNDSINLRGTVAIPEPATILLVGIGMALGGRLYRRQRMS